MRSIFLLLFSLMSLCGINPSLAQQVVFEKKYSGFPNLPPGFIHLWSQGQQVEQLPDSTILIMGQGVADDTTQLYASELYTELKKLDKNGNIIWTQYIRPDTILNNNIGLDNTSFLTLENGNILLIGELDLGMSSRRTALTLLDSAGQQLFDTSYLSSYPNYVYTVPAGSAKCSDGFIIAGRTFVAYGDDEAYVLKLNNFFAKQWEFKLDPSYGHNAQFKRVFANSFGGFDCFGQVESANPEIHLFLFVRLNSTGQMTLLKTYGDSLSGLTMQDAFAGSDYRVIVGYSGGRLRNYMIKTDEDGNLLWHQKFSDTTESWYIPYSITADQNNEFLITGAINYYNGGSDIYLLKADVDGNKLWDETYGMNYSYDSCNWTNREIGFDVEPALDGKYLVCGANNINETYGVVMNLLKIAEGFPTSTDSPRTSEDIIRIYPNPFREEAVIIIPDENQASFKNIYISSISGKLVKELKGLSGKNVILSREGIPSGMYILIVETQDGNLYREKFVVI